MKTPIGEKILIAPCSVSSRHPGGRALRGRLLHALLRNVARGEDVRCRHGTTWAHLREPAHAAVAIPFRSAPGAAPDLALIAVSLARSHPLSAAAVRGGFMLAGGLVGVYAGGRAHVAVRLRPRGRPASPHDRVCAPSRREVWHSLGANLETTSCHRLYVRPASFPSGCAVAWACPPLLLGALPLVWGLGSSRVLRLAPSPCSIDCSRPRNVIPQTPGRT